MAIGGGRGSGAGAHVAHAGRGGGAHVAHDEDEGGQPGATRHVAAGGLGRRRPRLTDAQTERAVLDAALRELDGGLTVSLEHVSFERLVAEAGVSRASAYRRWPHKDLFLADLLLEVARATNLDEEERGVYLAALHELACRAGELLDPTSRRDLLVDLLRRALDADLRTLAGAPRWRSYVAVRATVAGLPEGQLRSAVSAELQATESDFTRRRAEVFALLADLVGYRPAGGLPREDGFRVLAEALGVVSTGFIVRALAARSSAVELVEAAPLGTTVPRVWTLPALVVTTVAFAFLEPDPDVVWDRDRVEAVRAGVTRAIEGPAWRPRGAGGVPDGTGRDEAPPDGRGRDEVPADRSQADSNASEDDGLRATDSTEEPC